MRPIQLAKSFKPKVWGSTRLAPWYPESTEKIGEVWFETEPPLPLLVKLIFTEEPLSVQVHPGDEFARLHEDSRGKTEMWHILRADPGARIAMGLRQEVDRDGLREAALSGKIEQLLNWVEVHPGDSFHIPAGTIHAIGGGIVLCEIQQHSDVTYRLYDYGRPRELHLERALEIADRGPWIPHATPPGVLATCDYYETRVIALDRPSSYRPDPDRFRLLIPIEGSGRLGGEAFASGEAWYVPAGADPFEIEPAPAATILETCVPGTKD